MPIIEVLAVGYSDDTNTMAFKIWRCVMVLATVLLSYVADGNPSGEDGVHRS